MPYGLTGQGNLPTLFPTLLLIPLVVRKLRPTNLKLILVAQTWARQSWDTTLLELSVVNHQKLLCRPDLLTFQDQEQVCHPGIQVGHPDPQKLNLAIWLLRS